MVSDRLLRALSKRHWNAQPKFPGGFRNWWHSPSLSRYVNQRISSFGETGVAGAIREAQGNKLLERAISVAAGNGDKELALISAGLVSHFALYEISEYRIEQARSRAAQIGLSDNISTSAADAFTQKHEPYDLVYWDHALHHMLDVSSAIKWSVEILKPGGLLVINDYVGPTRLQWRRHEIDFANEFLKEAEVAIGHKLPKVRYKTPISRLGQYYRDPSEAPQSDIIIPACRVHCDGFAPTPIGGAMINICGPIMGSSFAEDGPAHSILTNWDRAAQGKGMYHFAFGIWRKP